MKAYRVSRQYDGTTFSEIIYADTPAKAKYQYALNAEVDEPFSLMRFLRATREPCMDYAKSTNSQQELINRLNDKYKIGDSVEVVQDDGSVQTWTIKHDATLLGGHTAVIWVKEIASCYSAERVRF